MAAGCPSNYVTLWVAYNGTERTLQCDSSQKHWWQRNTRQGGAECQEEDWDQLQACSNSQTCSRGVTSTTTTLEYCCTSGENPASAAEVKCFNLYGKYSSGTEDCVHQYRPILPVCPKIDPDSLTVPSKVFAGTTATIYLTVAAYPNSSFNHPRLRHWSSESGPSTITPNISTHTDFIHLTVAYSFTVPSEGTVQLLLDYITPPEDSGCQSAYRNIKNRHDMMIVQGMLVERGGMEAVQ